MAENYKEFQSTRPVRGATRSAPADVISALISIHAPRAGRDFLLCNSVLADFISIHAPRAGRDSRPSSIVLRNTYFNPRAPCGARPKVSCNKCKIRYFNPRAPCGARLPSGNRAENQKAFQSTRPVRGATVFCSKTVNTRNNFNPRAPCGARLVPLLVFSARKVFQSTRPVRGATHGEAVKLLWNQFQSTRPVRGATRCVRFGPLAVSISIHAPRAGRDWAMTLKNAPQSKNFNPRAPCGARRGAQRQRVPGAAISIHAPRAGRDCGFVPAARSGRHFNPRAPCGARHIKTLDKNLNDLFQSTRPVRGATGEASFNSEIQNISIHAPRAGRDVTPRRRLHRRMNFNPRAPCGARQYLPIEEINSTQFQSTRPVRGATTSGLRTPPTPIFQSTRPVRGATRQEDALEFFQAFQSTRPVRGATFLVDIKTELEEFQSTRPVRGATRTAGQGDRRLHHFNPRAPCGARPMLIVLFYRPFQISIHAPRAGRDLSGFLQGQRLVYFNPRAPCGARLSS